MSWGSLVLALLGLATALLQWISKKSSLEEGRDKAIGEAALKVLELTEYGKELRSRIAALDDQSADELWRKMVDEGQ